MSFSEEGLVASSLDLASATAPLMAFFVAFCAAGRLLFLNEAEGLRTDDTITYLGLLCLGTQR